MADLQNNSIKEIQYIKDEDLKLIIQGYGYTDNTIIESFEVNNASEKMIGFQADYVVLILKLNCNGERKVHQLFIKVISKVNEAKAQMVLESNYFKHEMIFYEEIKSKIDLPGLKPWSPKHITNLRDAIVFEDLKFMGYVMRDRHEKFDVPHILETLKTLSRFHGATIIYEERMSKKLGKPYHINEDYTQCLGKGSFHERNAWFTQCRDGALEIVKKYSKNRDSKNLLKTVEENWDAVWNSAYYLSGPSSEFRNVITHRDLWSNNILFHYKKSRGSLVPDNCVLVDFQGTGYQPPAGDVMTLLHCTLTPKFRKENQEMLLHFYYSELRAVLKSYDVDIQDVMTEDSFMKSAKEQNQWGLILHMSLVPVFWLDDERAMKMFVDPEQFDSILNKDKFTYMDTVMQQSDNYKQKLLETFEEFVDEYILNI